MFDDVPVRVWLLLFIAAVAWAPAQYVWRHAARSPSRRDITQPREDLSWRSSDALIRNIAILLGLAILAGFIFTRAAAEFARSPVFLPILMVGLGGFALWSVIKGYLSGIIEPMMRGVSWKFSRAEHPKRYWTSMGWNGLLGGTLLFLSAQQIIEAPTQALRDRCHDWTDVYAATEELAACNRLLAEHSEIDRSDVLAARGSAFYELGRYRRAALDYDAAIRLDPQDSSSHYNLGLVNERLGDRDRALAHYEAAISVDPKNAEAYGNRGLIFLDTGRFDKAIADFTRAHQLQPKNIQHVANRGMAYASKNDPPHAKLDFEAVRKSEPSNSVVLHGEAVLALRGGDLAGGVRLLSDAITRDPSDAWAFAMRAEAYGHMGEREKMLADGAMVQRLRKSSDN
jgi:tetratricopeptide (TPR) repeat protein